MSPCPLDAGESEHGRVVELESSLAVTPRSTGTTSSNIIHRISDRQHARQAVAWQLYGQYELTDPLWTRLWLTTVRLVRNSNYYT